MLTPAASAASAADVRRIPGFGQALALLRLCLSGAKRPCGILHYLRMIGIKVIENPSIWAVWMVL
jgi:hypothetical protein